MFEDRKELLLLVFAVLFCLTLGFAAGLSYSRGPTTPLLAPTALTSEVAEEEAESVAGNKVVKFVSKSASGRVASISDQTLVLEEDGDTLTVIVAVDARIARTALPEGAREEIRLSQVKIGDRVDALLYSQPDGSFLANEVTVLSEP